MRQLHICFSTVAFFVFVVAISSAQAQEIPFGPNPKEFKLIRARDGRALVTLVYNSSQRLTGFRLGGTDAFGLRFSGELAGRTRGGRVLTASRIGLTSIAPHLETSLNYYSLSANYPMMSGPLALMAGRHGPALRLTYRPDAPWSFTALAARLYSLRYPSRERIVSVFGVDYAASSTVGITLEAHAFEDVRPLAVPARTSMSLLRINYKPSAAETLGVELARTAGSNDGWNIGVAWSLSRKPRSALTVQLRQKTTFRPTAAQESTFELAWSRLLEGGERLSITMRVKHSSSEGLTPILRFEYTY